MNRDETRPLTSFEEFWPFYVGEHRHPLCRALHYAGTTAALGTVAAAVVTGNPLWLVATPIVGYGPAWVAHYLVEHNRPATFTHPLWSLRADFKMLGLALQGKMGEEVARLYGSAFPAPDAPLAPAADGHGTTASVAATPPPATEANGVHGASIPV